MDPTTIAAIIILPVASFLLVFAFLWWCLCTTNGEEREDAKEAKSDESRRRWIAHAASREETEAVSPSLDLEESAATNVPSVVIENHKESPVRKVNVFRTSRWMSTRKKTDKESSSLVVSEADDVDVACSVDNEELTMEDNFENRSSPTRVIRKLFQSMSVTEIKHSAAIPEEVFSSGLHSYDDASHPDDEITINENLDRSVDRTLTSRDVYTTF